MKKIDVSKYIPNTLVAAPGEIELGEKLSPFIQTASDWFGQNICSLDLLGDELFSDEDSDSDPIREYAEKIIISEAYRLAVPQLDLVLTANGFATVDSKNIPPASKHRTDRLLNGLLEFRDRSIKVLLLRLPDLEGWLESERGDFFRQSLFQNPDDTDLFTYDEPDITKGSWNHFLKTLPKIKDLEDSLADEWFSPELMTNLRKEKQDRSIDGLRKIVADRIYNRIVDYFITGDFKTRNLADILNIIRKNPNVFPEWVNSETSELFYPPIFRNSKNSKGYFF